MFSPIIVLSPSFVFRQSMFCHGGLFPVVLVANAGLDMGHHGSFLTVFPLDQPDYSRNFQTCFKNVQSTVFLKDKTPTEIESKLFSPMTLRLNCPPVSEIKQVRQDSTSMVS
jgi:hypothetical protein